MKAALANVVERHAGRIVVIGVYLAATAIVVPLSLWTNAPTP